MSILGYAYVEHFGSFDGVSPLAMGTVIRWPYSFSVLNVPVRT